MSGYANLPCTIEDMQIHDIDEVMGIEHRSFSSPWSVRAYRYELTGNRCSRFLVVRQSLPGGGVAKDSPNSLNRFPRTSPRAVNSPVLGYGGFWLLVNDAHISTLAVAPGWRRLGLGELLVIGLLERAEKVIEGLGYKAVRVDIEADPSRLAILERHVAHQVCDLQGLVQLEEAVFPRLLVVEGQPRLLGRAKGLDSPELYPLGRTQAGQLFQQVRALVALAHNVSCVLGLSENRHFGTPSGGPRLQRGVSNGEGGILPAARRRSLCSRRRITERAGFEPAVRV